MPRQFTKESDYFERGKREPNVAKEGKRSQKYPKSAVCTEFDVTYKDHLEASIRTVIISIISAQVVAA